MGTRRAPGLASQRPAPTGQPRAVRFADHSLRHCWDDRANRLAQAATVGARAALRCCLALTAWSLVEVSGGLSLSGTTNSLSAQELPRDTREGRRARPTSVDEFQTQVPSRPYDIVLGNPTGTSVTASVLAYETLEGRFEFGTRPGAYTGRTALIRLNAGEPREVQLERLEPNAGYYYRWLWRPATERPLVPSPEHRFRTGREPGEPFVFTVQADSHLDNRTDTNLYRASLRQAAAAKPDFHIDLGDTFMTDKRRADYREALEQYLAQRYYLGLIGRVAPVFLVSGNHDGEGRGRGSMGEWARQRREAYFTTPSDGLARGNHYAWEWGDALFVALDPFWATVRRGGRRDNWVHTLGQQQYRWLETTLRASTARFKFVFVHHLVGGVTRASRGGKAAATLYEWGGQGAGGAYEFDQHRPGWDRPIHRVLVEAGVSVVFHGHDHMFAAEELDGIVYLLVPQPGLDRLGAPRDSAAIYSGADIVGGPGHVRVRVSTESAQIELVRASVDEAAPEAGHVVYKTTVRSRCSEDCK